MIIDKEEKQEYNFVHELEVEVAHLNEVGILKPGAYQALFAQLAERHLSVFKADVNETTKYGMAWVLISMSIDVLHPINSCMKLYAHTWYSQRKGPYFRRELVFCNEKDEVMFRGSTFSVLLDVASRTVFRKKTVPFYLDEPREVFCTEADPHCRETGDFAEIYTRRVYNSYIDCLGHVNNCRYGDFAFDALDDEEIIKMKHLKRMDFYFISELRKNDSFTVYKAVGDNKIIIQGRNTDTDNTAFNIVFHY